MHLCPIAQLLGDKNRTLNSRQLVPLLVGHDLLEALS